MASTRGSSGAARLAGLLLLGGAACATTTGDRDSAPAPVSPRPAAAAHEDGLAMRAERGSIDRDEAEEAISRHWSRLKACYDAAGPATAFAGGEVTLHFDVAVDGRATAVAVESSRLGNLAVERCLVDAGLDVRCARPHGGGRASFEYSMEFKSSQERTVIDLPDEVTPALRTAALARLGADCGNLGPGVWSTTFYVDRRGQVQSAGLAAKTPIPADRAACLIGALQRSPLATATTAWGLVGDALGRTTITFSNPDVVAAMNAPPPAPAVATRTQKRPKRTLREPVAQGRRQRR